MTRTMPFVLLVGLLLPSLAQAEEPLSNEEQLAMLRHSGTYQTGLKLVREKIEFAYDVGARTGASRWGTIHGHYVELARAKGCAQGAPYAEGPVKACHEVSTSEPQLLGASFKKGQQDVVSQALESLHPERVKSVLLVIYDYGYVQGLKHGVRKNNDGLVWTQMFYGSCVEQTNDAAHEPICADASKAWSESILKRLRAQIEGHGLPVGKKPK